MTFPSTAEIIDAMPIIASLIVIEGLLSVDNALAIASLAGHLPGKQKYQALKYGIIGAYLFRGIALAGAAFIIANQWLRIAGAAYLLYLMSKNVGFDAAGDDGDAGHVAKPSFFMTIVQIELLDLSLSLDNVVAAVAFSPKLWVVCTGVFIGILTLRFLAGYCIRLIEVFPVLGTTAFLLVGYVGVILLVEEASRLNGHEIHVGSLGKFVGILIIVALTVLYSRSRRMQTVGGPIVRVSRVPMRVFAGAVDTLAWPITRLAQVFRFKRGT